MFNKPPVEAVPTAFDGAQPAAASANPPADVRGAASAGVNGEELRVAATLGVTALRHTPTNELNPRAAEQRKEAEGIRNKKPQP